MRAVRVLKRHALKCYAGLAALAILYTGYVFWQNQQQHFPKLTPGLYRGVITGLASAAGDLPFVLFREDDARGTLVAPLRGEFPAQRSDTAVAGAGNEILLPLVLRGAHGKLSLTGEKRGAYAAGGIARETPGNFRGTWSLERIEAGTGASPEDTELRLWLLLAGERSAVEAQLAAKKAAAEEQKEQIAQLSAEISDTDALRAQGAEKYREIAAEIRDAQKNLQSKQQAALALAEKVEVTQRTTGWGKLVVLSRESEDREARWIDSYFKTLPAAGSSDVDAAYERGLRIQDLRREIDAERSRVFALIGSGQEEAHVLP